MYFYSRYHVHTMFTHLLYNYRIILFETPNQINQCLHFSFFALTEKRNLTINRNTGETVLHKASRMGYDVSFFSVVIINLRLSLNFSTIRSIFTIITIIGILNYFVTL